LAFKECQKLERRYAPFGPVPLNADHGAADRIRLESPWIYRLATDKSLILDGSFGLMRL